MKIWRRNRKDDFDIFLPQHVYHKMLAYAKVCDGEISGWGKTKVTKKKDETITHVTVVDIRIFKQVCNAGHTSLDGDMLTKFYVELSKQGENMADWNLWWHSHNDFGVFFSGEDDDTAEKYSAGRLYSICINKNGDLVARVDDHHKRIAEGIDPRIENPVQESLMATCRAEVKKKVKIEHYHYRKHKGPIIIHGTDGFSDFDDGQFYGSGYVAPFTPTHDDHHPFTTGVPAKRRFPVNGEPHGTFVSSSFGPGADDDRFDHLNRKERIEYYNKRIRRTHDGD